MPSLHEFRSSYRWAVMNLARLLLVLLVCVPSARAAGRYFVVEYPASKKPKELQMAVTYTLWLPDGVSKLRGVIVHQHGCGVGACKGGETAAYDLHWQALAKKWDCALLGPSYHQAEKQNCRLWCDPRNGSAKTFLDSLGDLGAKSKHPELASVPWCLWGHSGGGFWASLMQTLYPERIVAIWFRSGTAYPVWQKGEIPKPSIPESAYSIPMMCNPGVKEKGTRFDRAWTGSLAMFRDYRKRGAPIGFAPDPRTSHQCGDSRYLAIPFFDACLRLRLPEPDADLQTLKKIDMSTSWFAPVLGKKAISASEFDGKHSEAVWLPDESVAKAWQEYVAKGAVADSTPPPPPFSLKAKRTDVGVELSWDAEADFESGLGGFVILRDSKEIAKLPQKPNRRFGRPLFQGMSYHDTPVAPLVKMRYVDKEAGPIIGPKYEISAINSVGLRSKPTSVTPTKCG